MKNLFAFLIVFALVGCASQGARNADDSQSRNRAKLHTELAAAYYAQGQMAIALEEFTKATQIDPSYASA